MNAADIPNHQRIRSDWYCGYHKATFEPAEAKRNDGNCPWCGVEIYSDFGGDA